MSERTVKDKSSKPTKKEPSIRAARRQRMDFDPDQSVRKRKNCDAKAQMPRGNPELSENLEIRERVSQMPRDNGKIYDDNGIFIPTNEDLCDCLDRYCPGCHFPCPRCDSTKCAIVCRQGRDFMYEDIEIEGKGKLTTNVHYKDIIEKYRQGALFDCNDNLNGEFGPNFQEKYRQGALFDCNDNLNEEFCPNLQL